MANRVTLAVAGSRKTQGIVEHCASLPPDRPVLVLTYTQANQAELRRRLAQHAPNHAAVVVMGWFTFLLRDFARPFLPFKFPGQRVLGFNFDGRPFQRATGISRFLDSTGAAYQCELARLAYELVEASGGALVRRLENIYSEILVDEVQDLSGYDWNVVDVLLAATIDVRMVGDIRQSVFSTNPRGQKNKQYAYAGAVNWFREREARSELTIEHNATTWRCHPKIAEFSDTIFDAKWDFPRTSSVNQETTAHDGVYLLHPDDIAAYCVCYGPQCLRDTANSGKQFELDYMNFRVAKGLMWERVLIVPTAGITKFVQTGTCLAPVAAAKLYVAVTRAAQSVAIVLAKPGGSLLPYWKPSESASRVGG